MKINNNEANDEPNYEPNDVHLSIAQANEHGHDAIFREHHVYTNSKGEDTSEFIEYPAPKEVLAAYLSRVGIGIKESGYYCEAFESLVPGIEERFIPQRVHFDELNYLASRIQLLSPEQREVYAAALSTRRLTVWIN